MSDTPHTITVTGRTAQVRAHTDVAKATTDLDGDAKVRGTVAGVDPLPVPYWRAGNTFAPEGWSLSYGDTVDGWWCVQARVEGRILKADGTPGARTAYVTFHGDHRTGQLSERDKPPQWLQAIAAEHLPTWTARNPEEDTP